MFRRLMCMSFCFSLIASATAQNYRRVVPPTGPVGPRSYVEPRRYSTQAPSTVSAAAPTRTGPEILTRPTLIRSSGSYQLGGNIYAATDATTAAIVIAAPDVTLDLGGFTVVGRGATAPDAGGVAILADRITVRNGSITSFDSENQCAVMVSAGVRAFVLTDLKISHCDTGILLNPDNNDDNPVVGGRIDRCAVDEGSVGILAFASQGVSLQNCVVSGAAAKRQVPGEGSGMLLRGSSFIVDGCNMTGNTHGMRLDADFSLVRACSLSSNRNTGAYITGKGNRLEDCVISGNGITGATVLGENNAFVNDHFSGNGGHGLSLDKSGPTGANHTYIRDCAVMGNAAEGISDKGLGDTRIEGGFPATPAPGVSR
ncbi:MAG: right-handed parallel beta-helix repeat-containing protein [Candidatus Sumerlaeaceae bacterium]